MRTGAHLLAEALRAEGVTRLHLFPGGTIAPTLDAWIELGQEVLVARHEQGAGYAALAAARLGGEPQVVMVTSGPGVTNLLTVIADAYYDSTPLVAITGQIGSADSSGRERVRQRGFQEVPTAALAGAITKACLRPTHPDQLADVTAEAFWITRSGRPGPVVVDLPMDVQRNPASVAPAPRPADPAELPPPDEEGIEALGEWLRGARRPVLLAGQGVLQARASGLLRQIAERGSVPVATSLLGVGAFPGDHPLSLGLIGHTGCGWANRAVHACDLLLVLGARLDVRQTGTRTEAFVPEGRVVRVDIDEEELAQGRVRADLAVHADLAQVLERLLEGGPGPEKSAREAWLARIAQWRRELPLDDYPAGRGCHPAELLGTLDRLTRRDETVVVTGVGHHQQWVARHMSFDAPRRCLLTSGGHGAMGYDLPSAAGAALARPSARVLCVVGDGSFQINMQELGTVAAHHLPVKVVVMDNRRLAMVSQFQKITWGRDPSTGDRDPFDFRGFASLYGIPSFSLPDGDGSSEATLRSFLAVEGPALLHAEIDPACEVSPMLLAGQTLDEMWTWNRS